MRARALMMGVLVAVAGAACSGGDDAAEPTTTTAERTTTTQSPEDAFHSSLRSDVSADDDAFFDDALGAGQDLCTSLTGAAAGVNKDDAANDTPESDKAIGDTLQTMYVAAFMDGWKENPGVGAAIIRAAGEELCPEHLATIESLLQARDL